MLKVKAMILIFSVTTYHIEPNDDFLKKQKKKNTDTQINLPY